jgi:sn-glycerol 3-phosphate transport system substrate-binding protein
MDMSENYHRALKDTRGFRTLPFGRGHVSCARVSQKAIVAFVDLLAQPETRLCWHKAIGYVPLTNKRPTREIAVLQLNRGTPTENSLGFRFGNFTQSMFSQREEVEAVFPGKKDDRQAMDDATKRGNEILRQDERLNKRKY